MEALPLGVTWGDAVEIAGVFVVLGLYAWVAAALLGSAGGWRAPTPVSVWFFLAFTTYALGHGMHVAANSIHDMMIGTGASDPWGLAHFWDEWMGHVPVDLARILFVIAFLRMERERARMGQAVPPEPVGMPGAQRLLTIAGAIAYGFIYFATAVEGQTVFLALPFSAALAIYVAAARSAPAGHAPVRTFFTAAAIVSLVLFAIWGVWQRGFPEFTRAGIL